MPGTFILSLDCEGKWGMADCLDRHHDQALTTSRLSKAYEQLVDMFEQYGIRATFAFVMAFLLRECELESFDRLLLGNPKRPDPWLAQYRRARAGGALEGWHLPQALEIVREPGVHEIACHGFCHRPLAQDLISPAAARAELAAAQQVAELKRVNLQTFIFPRNLVGHLDQLRSAGFLGYRTALRSIKGLAGRALRTAEEFNIWRRPQEQKPWSGGLIPIPSGYFFNWPHGMRRIVPPEITQLRWRNLLRRVSNGRVVHLWLHPHNLVTAPSVGDALERVLADVAELQAAGSIQIMTQEQYCRDLIYAGTA